MENLEEMLDIETEYFGFAVADDKRLNLKRRKTWKFDDGTWSPVHVTFFEVPNRLSNLRPAACFQK